MKTVHAADAILACTEATRAGRTASVITTIRGNLGRVMESTHVSRVQPLRGRTVFIAGAGPSLSHALPHQNEIRRRGGVIMTTNTGLRAFTHVDVLVTMEGIDLTPWVDLNRTDAVVLDLMSSAAMWQKVVESGKPVYWATPPNTHMDECMVRGWRTPYTWYHFAAIVAAVAVTLEWGAWKIVLIGCDMAYDVAGGRTYASEAAWGDERTKLSEDENGIAQFCTSVAPERIERAAAANVPPPFTEQTAIALPRWGGEGGVVWAPGDFVVQRNSLSSYIVDVARRKGCHLTNASEGGAHIPGWEDVGIDSVMQDFVKGQSVKKRPVYDRVSMGEFDFRAGLALLANHEGFEHPVMPREAREWKAANWRNTPSVLI